MTTLSERVAKLRGKITPGPWSLSKTWEDSPLSYVKAPDGYLKITTPWVEGAWEDATCHHAEIEANAAALALVPDLLADHIRLVEENAGLRKERDDARFGIVQRQQLLDDYAAAEATITKHLAATVKALEPFVQVAEHDIGEDETDADRFHPMTTYNRAPIILVGHLRSARAAFEAIPEEIRGRIGG